MKSFGTLALLGTGALFFYAIATAGLGTTLGVLLVVAYCLAVFTGISFLATMFAGMLTKGSEADHLWALVPGLPFWSFCKLVYYTGCYWFAVFAITNWDYHGKLEEDFLLREAEAEFYNKTLVLNFKPWCSL